MEQTIPKIVRDVAVRYPDTAAQYSKDKDGVFQPVSFSQMYQSALDFGAGLLALGVKRGDHIGLISDNRKEWFQADLGIMGIGAADVPRGCDATEKELKYILSFAGCSVTVAENSSQVRKIVSLKDDIPELKTIITLEAKSEEDEMACKQKNVVLFSFAEIVEKGKAFRNENAGFVEAEVEKGSKDDLACIIFTSGTTGEPKGVMLIHSNFTTQLDELPSRIPLFPGAKVLCVLPVWHSFERLCEYVVLCQGSALCYSKPIGSVLLADFQKINPTLLPAVPRVYEAIYDGINRAMRKNGGIVFVLFRFFVGAAILHSKMDRTMFRKKARFGNDLLLLKWLVLFIPWLLLYPVKMLGGVIVFKKIRAKLGKNFMAGVSGGGALPPAIDNFFWAVGVNIVEGYGLTETAPVVGVRPVPNPIFGTVGTPIRGVEVKIVDDSGEELPAGKKGTVLVRGGIVMKGYYKKPELTAKSINKDGWLDTGDIGIKTVNGEIVLRGRKKDTIVLRGGENVEPLPIEMKMCESRFISQAVVLGQDERYLGALIVPAQDEIEAYAKENCITAKSYNELLNNAEIVKMIDNQVQSLVTGKAGFKIFERISRFTLLAKPFEVGIELSAKQEIMRYKLNDLYAKEIKAMFK